jgi:hypothetical protein
MIGQLTVVVVLAILRCCGKKRDFLAIVSGDGPEILHKQTLPVFLNNIIRKNRTLHLRTVYLFRLSFLLCGKTAKMTAYVLDHVVNASFPS